MALHYILDGYNIINKISYLKNKKLGEARTALIEFIGIYRPHGSPRNQITLVFDGSNEVSYEFKCVHDVQVVFTKNESADDFIKTYVDNCKSVSSICIVTDDKDIRLYCRSSGTTLMDVSDFMKKGLKTKRKKSAGVTDFKISPGDSIKITEELKSVWLK